MRLREPGLWHRLFGGDIEQHEAEVYSKAVETGGVVLTVRTAEAEVPKAMGILNQHTLVDVQDRALATWAAWKSTKWYLLLRRLLRPLPAKPLVD